MKSFSPLLMAIALLGVCACAQQPTSGMPGGGHDVAAAPQDASVDPTSALTTPPDITKRAPQTSNIASVR